MTKEMFSTTLAASWMVYAIIRGLRHGAEDQMFHTAIICVSVYVAASM